MDQNEPPWLFDEPEIPADDTPTRKPHYAGIALLVLLAVLLVLKGPSIVAYIHRAIPNDNIPWKTDLRAAIAESQRTKKPVLIHFTAAALAACQTMDRDVWADPEVQRAATDFIPVRLDADLASTHQAAKQYGVNTIPHTLLLDSHGAVGGEGSDMTRDDMLRLLERALPN